jgi:hypothetical protein
MPPDRCNAATAWNGWSLPSSLKTVAFAIGDIRAVRLDVHRHDTLVLRHRTNAAQV